MERNCQVLWNKCLDIIGDNVSDNVFNTWFLPIIPLKIENLEFTIQVPSQFFYEYLEEKYVDLIYATLNRIVGKGTVLNYRVIVDSTSKSHTTLQSEKIGTLLAEKKASKGMNKTPGTLEQPEQAWNANLNSK